MLLHSFWPFKYLVNNPLQLTAALHQLIILQPAVCKEIHKWVLQLKDS